MNKNEDIINYEFGGWPVFKMNVLEILEALGGTKVDDHIEFKLDNPVLSMYPLLLEDDGMGYGVNEEYITEVSTLNNRVNIFREKELPQDELKKHIFIF